MTETLAAFDAISGRGACPTPRRRSWEIILAHNAWPVACFPNDPERPPWQLAWPAGLPHNPGRPTRIRREDWLEVRQEAQAGRRWMIRSATSTPTSI